MTNANSVYDEIVKNQLLEIVPPEWGGVQANFAERRAARTSAHRLQICLQ
jgi:hypothetical protein